MLAPIRAPLANHDTTAPPTNIPRLAAPAAVPGLVLGLKGAVGEWTLGQPTTSDCPLQNCEFKSKGGSWTCCSCQQGPNTQGWCTMPMSRMTMNPESFSVESVETTCDHGCCSKCVQYGSSRDASPEMTFSEIRKGSASRKFGYSSATKSHRRGSAFSLPASGEESTPSPSTSKSSSASSGYKVGMEYTSGKAKSSKKRHKSKR
ncbi:Uncharacterized protein Y057_12946 [Fusarium fujikuroi]|nr:Uncharacterized protein Y057_12946 [Fusarium fujikuroi]